MSRAHSCHKHVVIAGHVYRTVPDSCWDIERRLTDMTIAGVECQALSPMPELLSYWMPIEDGKVMCRYLNDQIAGMVSADPMHFVGLGAVPLQDLDSAIRELEYVVNVLNFPGVEIASHVNDVTIGDVRFEPFFAAADALGVAIFVHPLRPAGSQRVVGAFTEQAVCFPGEVALAAASMITGGIAVRFPRLRVAFSHGGGGLATLLPRLEYAWNRFPALKESLPESPTAIAQRFYYDDLLFSPTLVRLLLDTFGISQVVLGSDYPFLLGDPDPVASLGKVGVDAATVRAVCADNAQRFLGITL